MVCCIGSVGLTGICGSPRAATNQQINSVIVDESRADARFLHFAVMHSRPFLKAAAQTTTVPILNKSNFSRIRIPLPPLAEQRQIAAMLSAVHRAIERQDRLIALTAELKRALMHKLFTEGTRGERQKQTEIGPVPESWQPMLLQSLFAREPSNGLYLPAALYGRGTLILRIDDFSNDGDVVRSAPNRVEAAEDDRRRFGLSKDDIVVNRVNSLSHLGKTALVGELSEPMLFESNMMRFRVNEKRIRPSFAFRVLNSPVGKTQILGAAKRAVAQSSINQGDVGRLLIPLPPTLEEQDTIISAIDAAEAKRRTHQRMRDLFRLLFRTLLHQLMTAQVRVHDLDLSTLDEAAAETTQVA